MGLLRARWRTYFAYSGTSVLITDIAGRVTGDGDTGFYARSTRFLSELVPRVDGAALTPVSLGLASAETLFGYWRIPPADGRPRDVYFEITSRVDEGLRQRIVVRNYSRERARFDLRLSFAADFADQEEVIAGRRRQSAPVRTAWDGASGELRFTYAHPRLDLATIVRVSAPVVRDDGDGTLALALDLPDHGEETVELVVEPVYQREVLRAPPSTRAERSTTLERAHERIRSCAPELVSTNATVARAWRSAVADVASLPLGIPEAPAMPAAGYPHYQQFFGRDSLTIGWQSLLATTEALRDSLHANARWQGTKRDDWYDEEPGKLLHQRRWGPLSRLDLDPFSHYYGDYATPPAFLIGLGEYLAWTGDVATARELLEPARRAIRWMDELGDLDGDGFLEYVTRSPQGLKNQGWKDSEDGILYPDGRIAENPLATCELQAWWYVGLQVGAFAFFVAGERREALRLLARSIRLRRAFNRAFWMERERFYALALDRDKRRIESITSNPGHLLASGIVPLDRARAVASRLLAADLFSGWGIRTLSADHAAYDPFSYHRGSVWPVENGTFAFGFARYGCWDALHRLAHGMFAASDLFVENRLPEALGGLPRDADHPHPGIYPNSAEPQGWSSSAVILLVQSLLDLHPIAPLGVVLVDPHLPPWLPDLELRGVTVRDAVFDLVCWRTRSGVTSYRVVHRAGRIRVVRQPAPEALGVSPLDRLRALAGSLRPGRH